jgi:hypothetical protein
MFMVEKILVRTEFLKYAVVLLAAVGCVQTADGQKIRVVRDLESANILSIKRTVNIPDGDLADRIEKDGRGRLTLAESPDKIRQAFVFCVPSVTKDVPSCVSRVFVTDLGTDETYEIIGEELFIEANRPSTSSNGSITPLSPTNAGPALTSGIGTSSISNK